MRCVEAESSAGDDAIGKDEAAGPHVDAGFYKAVAEHLETGAVSGRRMSELAEEEDGRLGGGVPLVGGCRHAL